MVYVVIALGVLFAICSLAVDLGRVRVARGELQLAADAAARYAAAGLGTGVSSAAVVDRALAAARDNHADGTPVAILRSDVQLGRWNPATREFNPGGTPNDAVRVTARRTSATGNAVPLLFAQVLGISTCNVTSRAVATCGSRADGIVGLESIDMSSHGQTDSYHSGVGPYSAGSARNRGNIRTNGDIDLKGRVVVRGDANPGPGRSISQGPGVTVYGSTSPLPTPLRFAPVDGAAAAAANDNAAIPSRYLSGGRFSVSGNDVVRFPAGTYYFAQFSMSENAVVEMDGRVTLYVNGDVTLGDGSRTYASRPSNLNINVIGNAVVAIKTSGDVHAVIFAPEGVVQIGGGGQLFGSVVARTLRVNAHGGIHYDESLGTTGPTGVLLVH